ncbi:GDSL Lipase/Acylhydrolase superfamily protein [Trifolium repens]|nr:GDSL Lipase/Acylhydrolase superfamily protein [Trifolium repens]
MGSKYVVAVVFFYISLAVANSIDFNYPAVFSFGDSNADTGTRVAAFGNQLPPPYGQNHFKTPSGRFCDGRLILDFLMDATNLPFLNPYMDSLGLPNFHRGCNFAASGSTIIPTTAGRISPFNFGVQVSQFQLFKARVLELLGGQNDLTVALYSQDLDQILALIPIIILGFEAGIKRLYDSGARNFWIHNTRPLGCSAHFIAQFGTDPSKLDELGCVRGHNLAAIAFNLHLQDLCNKLQGQYLDVNVTYVDIFTIQLDLIANHSQHGFEQPIMACCGYGGPPLNYDSRINCGETKVLNGTIVTATGCNDSSVYVSWDGAHYTEAANQHVASQILTGNYINTRSSEKMSFLL